MLKVFVIFCAILNFVASSPTTTFEPETTEENFQIESEVQTLSHFLVTMTVEGTFVEDFLNRDSKAFKELSTAIDTELIYIVESAFDNKIELESKSFVVKNVFPSSFEGFLYVFILAEVKVGDEELWESSIREKVEGGKLLETKVKSEGFGWTKVDGDFDDVTECESEFCASFNSLPSPTEAPQLIPSPQPQPTPSQCKARDELQFRSTSIFIYEDKNCFEHATSQKAGSSASCKSKPSQMNEISKTCKRNSNFVDDQTIDDDVDESSGDEKENFEAEETIVVIKKKGNKVFIEI